MLCIRPLFCLFSRLFQHAAGEGQQICRLRIQALLGGILHQIPPDLDVPANLAAHLHKRFGKDTSYKVGCQEFPHIIHKIKAAQGCQLGISADTPLKAAAGGMVVINGSSGPHEIVGHTQKSGSNRLRHRPPGIFPPGTQTRRTGVSRPMRRVRLPRSAQPLQIKQPGGCLPRAKR